MNKINTFSMDSIGLLIKENKYYFMLPGYLKKLDEKMRIYTNSIIMNTKYMTVRNCIFNQFFLSKLKHSS